MIFDKSHWDKVFPVLVWPSAKEAPLRSDCLHDNCPYCKGTGIKSTGGFCIHGISCPCTKCRVYS